MAKVFFSYSHDDEQHRDQLEKHLSALKHEGLIDSWHDRRLVVGTYVDQEIDNQLEEADIVLLLVSASFLASSYCYGIELQRALQRHHEGKCKVVPVIVRACEWMKTPLGKLVATPRDGKPITLWVNYDEAMADVAFQIRKVLETLPLPHSGSPVPTAQPLLSAGTVRRSSGVSLPRSSNMRLRNDFTDADKDKFLHESFDYFAQFFEGSLQELQNRHSGIEGRFRRIDADTFTAVVYKDGKKVAECAIRVGGPFGAHSISYSSDSSSRGNSANNMLNVGNDEIALFWKSSFGGFGSNDKAKMTKEQAAEYYWSTLMRPLQ